jgi:hypothetical protein
MSSTSKECPTCGSILKTGSDVCETCGFIPPKGQDAPAQVEAQPVPTAPPVEDDLIELPLEAEVKKPRVVPNPVRSGSPPPPRAPAVTGAEGQKAAQAQTDAQRQQQVLMLKQQRAAMAKILAQKNEAQTQVKLATTQPPGSGANIVLLLKKYEGQAVGINYDNSANIRAAELAEVNSDYFTVVVPEKKLRFTFPLRTLLSVVEGDDGVEAVVGGTATKMKVVLKVYPLVLF